MKKYIHIAKGIKPTLTQAACDKIAEEYARLRSFDTENTDVARVRSSSLAIFSGFAAVVQSSRLLF